MRSIGHVNVMMITIADARTMRCMYRDRLDNLSSEMLFIHEHTKELLVIVS